MSADNFIAVRRYKGKWAVKHGNASTGHEFEPHDEDIFETRSEAIDRAGEIQREDYIEYGLAGIDKEPKDDMTPVEKMNACVALLVEMLMIETNVDHVSVELKDLTQEDKLLGSFKLTIDKTK